MSRPRVRHSCLAGAWYSGTRDSLRGQIESLFTGPLGPGSIPKLSQKKDPALLALISPHAGYIFSGQAAAWAFWEAAKYGPRDVVVLLGPNHRGAGSPISASSAAIWTTPLGESEVDDEATKEIARRSRLLDIDDRAHQLEHSIEIQLPFVQYVLGATKIVAIASYVGDLEESMTLGKAISEATKQKTVLVVGSSDMTHYMPHAEVVKRDHETLSEILSLDERSLWRKASHLESLCGLDAVVATVSAAKASGCRSAKVLCHYTSGDVTGDMDSVVGYASIGFYSDS